MSQIYSVTQLKRLFPHSKAILQSTCHSELFIYAEDYNKILPVLKEVTDNSELVLSKNAFDWK